MRRGMKDGRKGKISQEAGAVENGYDINLWTDWRMPPHPGIITRKAIAYILGLTGELFHTQE